MLLLILLLLSLNSLTFSESCNPNDKNALLKIKKDLNNPYFISWDSKTDCCNWNAVKCDDMTHHRVTKLDFDGAVVLNLPIPASIGDLPYLDFLSIPHANIIGHIPEAISKLSNLKYLVLNWNNLTGPVPSFLTKLKNLRYIDLSSNNLTGPIPASLSQLPDLADLRLGENKLTGEIPESFADFKHQDDFFLELSGNRLTGRIPARLGRANFTWLGVSRNRLEGDVSFLFGKNKSLSFADLSWNALDFDMSKVEYFPKSLTYLDLSHNRIRGRLPEGLVELERVELNVSYNRLCGPIPVGGRLQEMGYTAYFHNKCLCGAPLSKCK